MERRVELLQSMEEEGALGREWSCCSAIGKKGEGRHGWEWEEVDELLLA